MSFRETTNYGFDPYVDRNSGAQFGLVIDRLIGTAFYVVKCVQENLDVIKYVAFNMEAITKVAQGFEANNPLILAAVTATETAATNAATAAQVLANQTAIAPYVLAWLNSLPVWSGTGPLPVDTGSWFMNNGKPEQAQ